MPSILVEKTGGHLSKVTEDLSNLPKGCIGRLKGIAADFMKPTRNGRRYPLALWENILSSPDFQEGMSTKTIFGENDHPEDRADTSIKEASVVLTSMEINRQSGTVDVTLDILDTPPGRALKTILEYGSILGVSSRGLGDEIQRDGEIVIDENSYVFYGFDVVVMPAVKSARPRMIESADRAKKASSIESFKQQIEKASNADELNSIKKIIESIQSPALGSLVESINHKLDSLDGDDISKKLESEIGSLAKRNETLRAKLHESRSERSANDIRARQAEAVVRKLRRELKSIGEGYRELASQKESLEESLSQVNSKLSQSRKLNALRESQLRSLKESLETERTEKAEQLKELKEKCRGLSSELASRGKEISALKESNSSAVKEARALREDKSGLLSQISTLTEDRDALSERISDLESDLEQSESTIVSLREDLEDASAKKILTEKAKSEANGLRAKLEKKDQTISAITERYLKSKCESDRVDLKAIKESLPTNFTVDDIDKAVSAFADRKRRLDKLPIHLENRISATVVDPPDSMTEEDRQLLSILNAGTSQN